VAGLRTYIKGLLLNALGKQQQPNIASILGEAFCLTKLSMAAFNHEGVPLNASWILTPGR
jgi:hypothetical protein